MTAQIEIRDAVPSEHAAIESLYDEAFPDEDLRPLLQDLHRAQSGIASLVGLVAGRLVAHVVLTMCGIDGHSDKVTLLGPLGVAPNFQRQGIGSAMVHAGLDRARDSAATHVLVLGDPGYYRRFGFRADGNISPPYDLPVDWREAWQSIGLRGDTAPARGKLAVPEPWRRRSLWLPQDGSL